MSDRTQIVATIGPASSSKETCKAMIEAGVDIIRLNFSWSNPDERRAQIATVREVSGELGKRVCILQDLPGPRIQTGETHTYNSDFESLLSAEDEESIRFGAELGIEYLALSFVGSKKDVEDGRALVQKHNGSQKIIAKIERKVAVERVDEILAAADGLMVARGDLGSEVPLEEIPFIEAMLIQKAIEAKKPVIVATQMMLSMVERPTPTRAEVTDVAWAAMQGADAVMLSEESAIGKHPVAVVSMMERIIRKTQEHAGGKIAQHSL